MNINSPSSLFVKLAAAGEIEGIVSYVVIDNTTAGISEVLTDEFITDGTTYVAIVVGEVGVTKQVKHIELLNDSGGAVEAFFKIGEPE